MISGSSYSPSVLSIGGSSIKTATSMTVLDSSSAYTRESVTNYAYTASRINYGGGTANNYSFIRLVNPSSITWETIYYYLRDSDGDYYRDSRRIIKSYTQETWQYCTYTASSFKASSTGTIPVLTEFSSYTKESTKTANYSPSTYTKESVGYIDIYKEKLTQSTKTFMVI